MGVRHGQIFVLFGAMSVLYALRANLSVAIVAMTTPDTDSEYEVVAWSTAEKGVLLGTFFYGYVISSVPSGFLTNRFRTRYVLSVSCFISGVLTIVFPFVALRLGIVGSAIARAVLGLFEGVLFPCVLSHVGKWSVPNERARFTSFSTCGASFGSTVMQSAAGLLAASQGGWPSIFYVSGGVSIIWGIVCIWFLRESPKDHNGISLAERQLLESSLTENSDKWRTMPIPWRRIFTSIPIWSAVAAQFSYCWGFVILQTMLPTYLKSSFGFDIAKNGLLSSLPILGMVVSSILSPFFAEFVGTRFKLSLTLQRRLWNSLGLLGSALCFIGIGLFQPGPTVGIILLVVENVLLAYVHLGYMCSYVDMSPNFSGVTVGVGNCVGQIGSLLAPTITGFILHDDGIPFEWSVVFLLTSAILAIGGVFYAISATAIIQPWNDTNPNKKVDE